MEAMEAILSRSTTCKKCKNLSTNAINDRKTNDNDDKSSSPINDNNDKVKKKKAKTSDEEVKVPINHHDESQSALVQEKVYGQCPTCKQIRFWENQCYDVNCHAGTLIKILNQRLIDSAKAGTTQANKRQAPTTPWSKSNSKKSVTFDDNNGHQQSMPATLTPPTPTVSEHTYIK
jgi:hypothetical protein